MAVRLIEKLSSSLPSWLKDAITNSEKRTSANPWRSWDKDEYRSYSNYNGQRPTSVYRNTHFNYPLDKITYEERPIPKNMATIRRDFEAGNDPVIKMRYNRYSSDDEYIVCILHNPSDAYDRRNYSSERQFKDAWEDNIPIYDKKWRSVKDYIIEYGVIINGDQEAVNLNKERTNRNELRKYWEIPDPYEVERQTMKKHRRMKLGAYAIKLFKELDALYDDITATFNQALEVIDTSEDDGLVNRIYGETKKVKDYYDDAIDYIERTMERIQNADEEFRYNNPTNYSEANDATILISRTRSSLRELKRLLGET